MMFSFFKRACGPSQVHRECVGSQGSQSITRKRRSASFTAAASCFDSPPIRPDDQRAIERKELEADLAGGVQPRLPPVLNRDVARSFAGGGCDHGQNRLLVSVVEARRRDDQPRPALGGSPVGEGKRDDHDIKWLKGRALRPRPRARAIRASLRPGHAGTRPAPGTTLRITRRLPSISKAIMSPSRKSAASLIVLGIVIWPRDVILANSIDPFPRHSE